MKHHCLTREEYNQFIQQLISKKGIDDEFDYLNDLIEDSQNDWRTNLIGFNHFLSIRLEQLMKQNIDCQVIIDNIYNLENTMYFTIQEGDIDFLKNLVENHLPKKLSLEDCLIQAQKNIYG